VTYVLQRLSVGCPYPLAEQYLTGTIAPFIASGNAEAFDLITPVEVRYGCGEDPLHFDRVWTVSWAHFSGSLTVRPDYERTACVLELSGTFDGVAGSRAAARTANDVLRSLRDRLITKYHLHETPQKGKQ
jgi:hypothetical protein